MSTLRSGLRYADELTTDMVWEIGDFLLPRLERAASTHPVDSEEGITASALAEAVVTLVLTLEWAISGGTPGRARVPVGIPLPPPLPEEERRVRGEERLERLREEWNTLCLLAGYWHAAPGYQGSRWCKPKFSWTKPSPRPSRAPTACSPGARVTVPRPCGALDSPP